MRQVDSSTKPLAAAGLRKVSERYDSNAPALCNLTRTVSHLIMLYVLQKGANMPDAMVTARMPQSKKDAGGRILESLGTNASAAINGLYDYVISKRELPFGKEDTPAAPAKEDLVAALSWVDSIIEVEPGELSELSLKEAKRHKLIARGLLEEGEARS